MKLQTLANLTTLYNEPQRHYHNLSHIHRCLAEYENYVRIHSDKDHYANVVKTAIWWHDAVYNPFSSKNEIESAQLFYDSLENGEKHWGYNELVSRIILATAFHTKDQIIDLGDEESNNSMKLMLDIDLSSIGHSYEEFKTNGVNIKKEYSYLPDKIFYSNRKAFLEKMLQRKRIFYTDFFYNNYEFRARDNIEKDIIIASALISLT